MNLMDRIDTRRKRNVINNINFRKFVIIRTVIGNNNYYNRDKDGDNMRSKRKRSFSELVLENKRQLLNDRVAIEKIEEKIEKKRLSKAE